MTTDDKIRVESFDNASPCDSEKAKCRIVKRVTVIGLVINVLLAGAKAFAGIAGNSQALVADAVHSLSDTATDVAILIGVRFWSLPADQNHPHGHRRIETLIVMSIGLLLAVVAVGLGLRSISSLHDRTNGTPGWAVFAAALASIIVKELLYRWSIDIGRKEKSSSLIANAWHHRSDSLSSVPVALTVLGTKIMPGWDFLDHIGALIVAVMILQASWHIFKPAVEKLVDKGAPKETIQMITHIAKNTEGVKEVHAIRTRYIGCNALSTDLHILVNPRITVAEGHDIATKVKKSLVKDIPEIMDVLVHTEPYEQE